MAVEYEIASDIAVISEVANTNQLAHVAKFYTGAVTYDDEASSKFATVTIDGKSQRVMLCIAVNGTVNYDDVPCKYSTVDGHRCLNVVEPNGTEIVDDVPSVYETMVVDGKTVRAIRCVLINQTPIYDGVSSVCTFVDSGKTHTAQLVNVVGAGSIEVIVKGVPPLILPDAVEGDLVSLKAFGGTEQGLPAGYTALTYVENSATTLVPLGVSFGTSNFKMEITAVVQNGSLNLFQSQTSGGLTRGIGGSSSNTIYGKAGSLNDVSITANNYRTAGHKYAISFTAESGTGTLKVDDLTAETTETVTGTYTTGVDSTEEICLFGNTQAQYVGAGTQIFSAKLWKDGALVLDLVPSRKGATIGFFDLVSRTFKTASTGTLLAGLDTTLGPTPDAPIDIVSNNGVLKARHQSGLPYTLLEYLQSDGASYLIVPYHVNNKTVFYCRYNEVRKGPQAADAVFGVTDSPNTNIAYNGILRLFGSSFNRMGWGDNTIGSVIDVPTAPKDFDTWYEVLYDQNKLYQDGTLYATSATDPSTVWSANYDLGIFARNGSSVTMPAVVKISSIWAKEDGEYKLNLVPAKRNSDNVLGMYDLVSGQFFTNQGTGDFVAGDPVAGPVEIYADGTVETINVHGKNLFNSTPYKTGYYIDASGQEQPGTPQDEYIIRQAIVQPSTTYTISFVGVNANYTQRFHAYDKDGNWISQIVALTPSVGNTTNYTFTTPANCKYIRQGGKSQSNYQLERGSTATTYEPYYDGGTATAEMLLKVGDYQDVQSILDGVVTRKCGIRVFDGTESWAQAVTPSIFNVQAWDSPLLITPARLAIPSTHFVGTDAANLDMPNDTIKLTNSTLFSGNGTITIKSGTYNTLAGWKQFLAQQYAAGTPVIVVYPLATPTTETVTGQTLQVTSGDNVLEITQASLDGLELEVTYMAGVQLTVEEVEDEQLSPDVEVTIQ